jgi:uncharacterized protein YaeQ
VPLGAGCGTASVEIGVEVDASVAVAVAVAVEVAVGVGVAVAVGVGVGLAVADGATPSSARAGCDAAPDASAAAATSKAGKRRIGPPQGDLQGNPLPAPECRRAGRAVKAGGVWALANSAEFGHHSRAMALPSTLHHIDLRFSQVDAGVDGQVVLRVARHPSETMERLWLRILAFVWKWREGMAFGPGLCEPEAPDVAAALPDGRMAAVVRVGKPDPQRIERDVNQNAGAVVAVLFESPRRLEAFLAEAQQGGYTRAAAADLAAADPALVKELGSREERRIKASITLVADHLYVEVDGRTLDAPLHRRAS